MNAPGYSLSSCLIWIITSLSCASSCWGTMDASRHQENKEEMCSLFSAPFKRYGTDNKQRGEQEYESLQETSGYGGIDARESDQGFPENDLSPKEVITRWYEKTTSATGEFFSKSWRSMVSLVRNAEWDESVALEYYRGRAEQGSAWHQNYLGWMYEWGKGTEKNEQEAFKWFAKAAEQGNSNAQTNLARMYLEGKGVEKNEQEAFKWGMKAAEQGNSNAQIELAWMYREGKGVEKNEQEAFKWYMKAAVQGDVYAPTFLARMYLEGTGVEKNEQEGLKWLEKARQQNDAGVQNNLGWMYANGQGVTLSYSAALEWWNKAAVQREPYALRNLALLYEFGLGVQQDRQKVVELYKEARQELPDTDYFQESYDAGQREDRGSPLTYLELAFLYEKGWGVAQNDKEAARYYQQALELGIMEAEARLLEIQSRIGTDRSNYLQEKSL